MFFFLIYINNVHGYIKYTYNIVNYKTVYTCTFNKLLRYQYIFITCIFWKKNSLLVFGNTPRIIALSIILFRFKGIQFLFIFSEESRNI